MKSIARAAIRAVTSVAITAASSATVALAVMGASLVAEHQAKAQTPDGFGEKGVLTINAQGGSELIGQENRIGLTPFLGLEFRNHSSPDNRSNHLRDNDVWFYVNPGVDYFILDRLSLGGEILFATHSHTTTAVVNGNDSGKTDSSETYFGIFPRVGYDIPLGRLFSVWPRGGIGYQSVSRSAGSPDEGWWYFQADVPFLLHPTAHFYAGAGPGITLTLSHTRSDPAPYESTTNFRLLSAVLGGWF